MKRLPIEYVKVLKIIQSLGYPEAVIGSGAVRDTYTGKPIKDVDIFVQTKIVNPPQVGFSFPTFITDRQRKKIKTLFGFDHYRNDKFSYATSNNYASQYHVAAIPNSLNTPVGANHVTAV